MNQRPIFHLTYDELLRTLSDVSDLSPEHQAHLVSCPRCQHQARDLRRRYHRLGQMARKMVPESSRTFRVSNHHVTKSRWYLKPGVAAGLLGVLVFVFTMWWPRPSNHSPALMPTAVYDRESEEHLMAQVDALVEDALPRAYQQVAAVVEPIFSQDLIDWIVPSIDETDEPDEGIEPRA